MGFKSSEWSPPINSAKMQTKTSTYGAIEANCLGAKVLVFENAIQDGVISNIRTKGEWERETFEAANLILKNIQSGSVLDVGANCGAFVLPLALQNMNKEIIFHAFEPQRMLFHQLCGGAALNGLKNIKIHNYGCGEHKHSIEINLPDYLGNSSGYSLVDDVIEKLKTEESHNYCYDGDLETLEIVDIDSMGLDDVVLIKIDVEGMELDVLKGAQKTIEKSGYPVILYESWKYNWRRNISSKADEYIKELGYKTINIDLETVVCLHPLNKKFSDGYS
jgi:FkbM family methyltransferase